MHPIKQLNPNKIILLPLRKDISVQQLDLNIYDRHGIQHPGRLDSTRKNELTPQTEKLKPRTLKLYTLKTRKATTLETQNHKTLNLKIINSETIQKPVILHLRTQKLNNVFKVHLRHKLQRCKAWCPKI